MKKVTIMLKTIGAASLLVKHTEGFAELDVSASQGKYSVDAKSILGMLSLVLTEPISLEIVGSKEDTARYIRVIDGEGFIKNV